MGFSDTWADAVPTDGPGEDNAPQDGPHDVALVDASAFTSKAGEDYAKLEWQTLDKQFRWTQLLGFGSAKQAGFSKSQCMKVGVDVDSVGALEQLDLALKESVGGFYEVTVERNGEFVNTYVNDGVKPPQADVPADTQGMAQEPVAAGQEPWNV